MMFPILRTWHIWFALVCCLATGTRSVQAGPIFHATTNPSQWQVAISQPGGILDVTTQSLSDFPTTGFATATSISAVPSRVNWIANNNTGSNSNTGQFFITLFTFRQTFDLTGFDPQTAQLNFDWAADDSGQALAARGTWKPAYSINGGPLVQGVWDDNFSYIPAAHSISSGFVNGSNTINFYVGGNAITDGLLIENVTFTASPTTTANVVPEPASAVLMGLGIVGMSCVTARRRRKVLINQPSASV